MLVTERRRRGHGQIRTEALCEEDLLYQETKLELSQFGNLEEEVVCQSEETVEPIPCHIPPKNENPHAFQSANVRVRVCVRPPCASAGLPARRRIRPGLPYKATRSAWQTRVR